MSTHPNNHTTDETPPFECRDPDCTKLFLEKGPMNVHHANVHAKPGESE